MAGFYEVYERLCERYPDPHERGREGLESLVAEVFRADPLYRNRFTEVWRWNDWPLRDGPDNGIDIVARRTDGEWVAAQVKCQDYISTGDLTKFITEFTREINGVAFSEGYMVTTATKWSTNATRTLEKRTPPVNRLDLFSLDALSIDWDAHLADESKPLTVTERKRPRQHQQNALRDVIKGFDTHDRGQLIMACGTGKTLTSLRIAEMSAGKGGRVLFSAPSLSLLSQSMRNWGADSEIPLRTFAVCSDRKVGQGDGDSTRIYDMPIPATTDAKTLVDAAGAEAPDQLTVIFSTYQSMQVIADAQEQGLPEFDLVVCDEAHRTAGVLDGDETSSFLMVHDGQKVRARKRLYMTATPRIYSIVAKNPSQLDDIFVASMDDPKQFGPEFHRFDFAEAIDTLDENGRPLLADYKVMILAVNQRQVAEEYQRLLIDDKSVDDVGKVIGVLNGLAKHDPELGQFDDDPGPMHRAVAFNNSINYSKAFVSLVEREQEDGDAVAARNLAVEVRHVDGKSGVPERDRQLTWLGDAMTMDQGCHVLSNARCLTEGIDVPGLDAVIFVQPRKSQIDIVQAVGRVMRQAEGKKYGYVILPVVVPAGQDVSRVLSTNAYRHVWQVLQALRSHDERLEAYINQIDLNENRGGKVAVVGVNGTNGDHAKSNRDQAARATQQVLDLDIDSLREVIFGKIVENCGDRQYWAKWAQSVTDIAQRHHERITALIDTPGGLVSAHFDQFVSALRHNLNESISRDDAVSMLSQHLITKPVFDALFGNQEFTERNAVSRVMQDMIDVLQGYGLEAETAELEDFYASVRRRVEGIDNAAGRQKVVVELYENFFKVAYPRLSKSLGIVYTPVEIVDFIIGSVQALLRREFKVSLRDQGVHVLDPFTGTGTFVTRLIQSGLIDREALAHKYGSELHANEIMLLAYYIAAVNVEMTYAEVAGQYEPFTGIVLTDTFQSSEDSDRKDLTFFPRNNERIERQLGLDIRVIVSNPPWSAGQERYEDDNPNLKYPTLDDKIAQTYVGQSSSKGLKNAMYDSYVRSVRWASDRVQDGDGGIVGFVVNSGFISAKSFDGFRKVLAQEYHEIYVYDMRGNQRTSGVVSKREGGQTFGQGSRAGVAILLLVRRSGAVTEPATLHYHDIGDYLTREQKLDTIGTAQFDEIEWTEITPNRYADWVNQRSEHFLGLRPVSIVQSEKYIPSPTPLFQKSSLGVGTGRDKWVFNSSDGKLRELVERQVEFYNGQVEELLAGADAVSSDPTRFKWERDADSKAKRGMIGEVSRSGFRPGIYRPFFRQNLYMDGVLTSQPFQIPSLFPTPDVRNPAIVVERGLPAIGRHTAIIATDITPDNKISAGASGHLCQVLPRYTYAEQPEDTQQSPQMWEEPHRLDNITDDALHSYQACYGQSVSKDQMFAYIYGILHSPDYRTRYAGDLAMLLPRIPQVSTKGAFFEFAEAGQELLDLHIGYESVEPYELQERVAPDAPDEPARYRVNKMQWGNTEQESFPPVLIYNKWITLTGIPDEAHEYIVGPRTALEWLIDRYQVTRDRKSGIVNDPNDWASEVGDPRYILDLVKRLVTVSVETVAIVKNLPVLVEA